MACTSSFSRCSLNGDLFTSKCSSWSNSESLRSCPNLSTKKLLDSKSICLSADMSERLSSMKRVQCGALKVETKPLFNAGSKFQLDDVIDSQQFDNDTLSAIFEVAREMEKIEKKSPGSQILKGSLMATLFYEPSTRTRLSFESAMKRLGGEVLTTENAREFSSAAYFRQAKNGLYIRMALLKLLLLGW